MPTIFDGQPEIYRRFLPPELFNAEVPEETKATCSTCAMCETSCGSSKLGASEKPGAPGLYFSPSTKCCTFHPNLPSYLVGAILLDPTPEMARGRERILEKIAGRSGVTPYGINASGLYTLLYQNSREFFGRSLEMRCPYYLEEGGGLCSVWRHREAVCSTYFCKHVAGSDGRRFYSTLKSHLALLERQLSKFVIDELYPDYLINDLHPSDPPSRRLEREELEGKPLLEASYKKLWGTWTGLERDFFEESYRRVSGLSTGEMQNILGVDGDVSLKILKKHHQAMTAPSLPKTLQLNMNLTVKYEGPEVIIGAYSELDALALPVAAMDLLQEFKTEHDVKTARANLRRNKQADFSDDVLLSLYQHRVLTEL